MISCQLTPEDTKTFQRHAIRAEVVYSSRSRNPGNEGNEPTATPSKKPHICYASLTLIHDHRPYPFH